MQLVLEVLSKCEGAYGLLLKSAHYPGELVACKRGSPLLLGIKTSIQIHQSSPRNHTSFDGAFEAFIASDASAIVEHTHQCAHLPIPCMPTYLPLISGAHDVSDIAMTEEARHQKTKRRGMSMCRVLVLEDNDLLHLARGAYTIYNLQRDDPSAKVASVSRAMSRLDMEVSAANPCRYSNAELN